MDPTGPRRRQRRSLLELPRADDIPAPVGQPPAAFQHTRDRIRELMDELSRLVAPLPP